MMIDWWQFLSQGTLPLLLVCVIGLSLHKLTIRLKTPMLVQQIVVQVSLWVFAQIGGQQLQAALHHEAYRVMMPVYAWYAYFFLGASYVVHGVWKVYVSRKNRRYYGSD